MIKRILGLVLITTIALSSSVFANGNKESSQKDDKMSLSVMHYYTSQESASDNTRKVPRETILEYGENNSDTLNLNITELQINDYETKMQALATANDLPDVFMVKGSWVKNFTENGLIADISSAVDNCEWKDEYRDGLFTPITKDGKIYGVPMQYSATTIVYYNKALWKQAGYSEFPKTWEEIFEAIPKFKELGVNTISFGNNSKWQYNSSWISALGPRVAGVDWVNSIIANDGKANFSDPSFIKLCKLTEDIGKSGAFNPDYAVIGHQQASSQFLQGKAATFIDGYWNVEYVASTATEEMMDNIGFAYLPTIEDGKGDASSIASGCGWFLAVNSKLTGEKLKAAENLVLYASGPELSQKLTDIGLVSTCKSTPSEDVNIDDFHQKYIEFVSNSTSSVPIWDANMNASVIATMNDEFVELLAGRTTPEKAAKLVQSEYEDN